MGTRCKCGCNFRGCTDGTDWHTATKSLRHRDDIRLDTIVHVAHRLTGSAPSGLYLINQEQHIILIAELTKSCHKLVGCRMDTAFTLDWLDHDRDRILGTSILKCLQIIVWRIRKTICHRSEANLTAIARLTSCGHRTKCSTMEAHLCSYDMITVWSVMLNTIFSCHLDHGFVCLCTGVLIEDLIHTDGCTHLLSQQCLRNRVRIVECMHDIIDLIFDGCNNLRVSASGIIYRDTCIEIQIRSSIFIVHVHALGCLCQEIKTLVCIDHVLAYLILDVLLC